MSCLQIQEKRVLNRDMINSVSKGTIRGELKYNEPMSRHTSWRVGGPADRFFNPADVDDLKKFLRLVPENEPLVWIGLGSNLLVRDGGIRGTVITLKNIAAGINSLSPGRFRVGAGIPCAKIARHTTGAGYTSAEFLVGIPGTFGGALAMNAGAFGFETWDIVYQVITVNRKGEQFNRVKDDFHIGYRTVDRPFHEWFLSADILLSPAIHNLDNETIHELLARRSETQPMGESSCGSVFRNPEVENTAAKLIESCGLKSKQIGKAVVSNKHANFIINKGNASAKNIEDLILHVQQVVYEGHAIRLVPEVCILGDPD